MTRLSARGSQPSIERVARICCTPACLYYLKAFDLSVNFTLPKVDSKGRTLLKAIAANVSTKGMIVVEAWVRAYDECGRKHSST